MTETKHPGDQHEVPQYEAHASDASLKDRIKQHYEIASDYYYSLWYVSLETCPLPPAEKNPPLEASIS